MQTLNIEHLIWQVKRANLRKCTKGKIAKIVRKALMQSDWPMTDWEILRRANSISLKSPFFKLWPPRGYWDTWQSVANIWIYNILEYLVIWIYSISLKSHFFQIMTPTRILSYMAECRKYWNIKIFLYIFWYMNIFNLCKIALFKTMTSKRTLRYI